MTPEYVHDNVERSLCCALPTEIKVHSPAAAAPSLSNLLKKKKPELVVVVLKNQMKAARGLCSLYTFDMLLMQSLRAQTYKVMPYFCLP